MRGDGGHVTAAYGVLHAAAIRMFLAHVWFCVAPARYPERLSEYATQEELSSAWPALGNGWTSHSFWLRWAAETGSVGSLGWLILLAWAFHRFDKNGKPGRMASCSLIGLLLNGFQVDFS